MKKINTNYRKIILFSAIGLTVLFLAFFVKKNNVTENQEKKINNTSKSNINIVVAFDNNYVYPAFVSIFSMLKNAEEDTFYKINFLITDEFNDDSKNKISKLKDTFDNFDINYINLSKKTQMFKDIEIFSERFSKEMFYRLLIPTLLPEESRCIYLDVDTIILKDLKKLYDQKIDGFYIGAVPDGIRGEIDEKNKNAKEKSDMEKYLKFLEISSLNQYINSGVILWNLDECRKDGIETKFVEFVEKNRHKDGLLCDQDVLNSICFDKIKSLSLEFNLQTYLPLSKTYEEVETAKYMATKEEWDAAKNNPTIIHYALDKPWSKLSVYSSELWWQYAKDSTFWDDIIKKYILKTAS
ncbi:MAG: glycosyltransferase family 8 protein [Oscillospiraceae bacterium]|jgi:lipopolysaccharide biosynthesis glycosyltransferase|nr:glycosyltransferase family 8 protein [Oscillospiraceae bacterium]